MPNKNRTSPSGVQPQQANNIVALPNTALPGWRPTAASRPGKTSLRGAAFFKLAQLWLKNLNCGRLEFVLPDSSAQVFDSGKPGPSADLHVRNARLLWRSLSRGALGFAEAYLDGDWETGDLEELFTFFLKNRTALARNRRFFRRTSRTDRLFHSLRPNNPAGARRNIAAHYDLGNAFYGLWLDPTMTYSSALNVAAAGSLEQAQLAKYDRVLSLLENTAENTGDPDAKLLEIGCGWGGFAERYLQKRNGHYSGITLSAEQLRFSRGRIAETNAASRAHFALTDYRDATGTYDSIVSIEMLEAVGEAYWPTYFAKMHNLMRPGGVAVLQVITIAEDGFAAYRRRPDFIQRYIFPGGMLPTKAHITEQASEAGLVLDQSHHFADDYALTLRHWLARFDANWAKISDLGFDERFRRMWRYYLTYCAAGFENGQIDVGLYRLQRP